MKITVYGLKTCDQIRKARAWLQQHALEYDFHDYKTQGITESTLSSWCKQADWQVLLNRRGTTWRKLTEEQKANIDQHKAIQLMQESPSLIKRPVVEVDNDIIVGFAESEFQERFNKT